MELTTGMVDNFYEENTEPYKSEVKQFICRQDGVVILAKTDNSISETSSIGALLGGVWQAAEALMSFIPKLSRDNELRLSFDSSADGLFIQPIDLDGNIYYYGIIYQDVTNPGELKNMARNYKEKMCAYFLDTAPEDSNIKENEFLFDDISNDEINNLFSFTEK